MSEPNNIQDPELALPSESSSYDPGAAERLLEHLNSVVGPALQSCVTQEQAMIIGIVVIANPGSHAQAFYLPQTKEGMSAEVISSIENRIACARLSMAILLGKLQNTFAFKIAQALKGLTRPSSE